VPNAVAHSRAAYKNTSNVVCRSGKAVEFYEFYDTAQLRDAVA
jgi:hypothetical protein